MKISLDWLSELIDLKGIKATELKDILTTIGLEVASIEKFHPIKGGLEGLVIGEVLEAQKIEGTNNLSATKVNIGDKILDIVCGAPNVKKGQKVVVATVGTTLFYQNKPLKIKKVKLRGHISEGMICAEDEIGLGNSHDGIMVLENNAPVGYLLKEYLNIKEDTIIEIDLTPNRIDAASHYGVARDIFAYFNAREKFLKLRKREVNLPQPTSKLDFNIKIEDTVGCKRYSGVTITGVEVKESPEWLKHKLMAIGLTPINNIVDITNFVLHETGQPLHAFDADKIKGKTIKIKTLKENTTFTTLDGEERKLSAQDLMICDAEDNPLCMAGILGGLNSGITDNTKNIFLESAWFNPTYIRKSSKKHNLHTDASFRFERGTDINNTIYPLKLATSLILQLAGGQLSMDIKDIYDNPIEETVVELEYDYINTILGKELDDFQIKNILEGLEIKIIAQKEKSFLATIPTYRIDVKRPADVIEEILRIYGYNNIETPKVVKSVLSFRKKPDKFSLTNQISDMLSNRGFREIMNNSLTASSYYKNLKTFPSEKLVKLKNPLSSELDVMRQTLLFGMLESTKRNVNRQKRDIRFYEFGNVYELKKPNDINFLSSYKETYKLALLISGFHKENFWDNKPYKNDYFLLKQEVELILKRLKIEITKKEHLQNEIIDYGIKYYHENNEIFFIGKVNSKLSKDFEIDFPVFFSETNFNLLMELSSKNSIKFEELPKYPEVQRDFAITLDKSISFLTIEEKIKSIKSNLIKEVFLFDIYENEEKLGKGKKSYAIRLTLQNRHKTLKDEEANKILFKIINKLEKEIGATIRK